MSDDEGRKRPTFGNPSHESLSRRGRVGAFTAHARRTREERSALARKAVEARWAKENARRAAEGVPLAGPHKARTAEGLNASLKAAREDYEQQ